MLDKLEFSLKKFRHKFIKWFLVGISYIYIILFLFLPTVNVFIQALNKGALHFFSIFFQQNFVHALKLTVVVSCITVPLNIVFGLSMAYILNKYKFLEKYLILSILDLPFSISPIIAGLMITLLYGKNGWIGIFFIHKGVKIVFALPGIILASAFVTIPFIVREIVPILEKVGEEQEEAARTMGANEFQVFWKITLPNIKSGLFYGIILTNARTMGEFGATSVISGNIIGKTQTLTLFIEQAYKEYNTQASFSAAVFLFALAILTSLFNEVLLNT